MLDTVREDFSGTLRNALQGVRIVCVQHLLETTGSLLESFVEMGCLPEDIHILGKFYSTSPLVERRLAAAGFDVLGWHGEVVPGKYQDTIRHNIQHLWQRAELKTTKHNGPILILDDGGRCRQYCPGWLDRDSAIAVEQTTSGLKARRTGNWIPTVEVAGSAAKRVLEPPAVTESILRYVIPRLRIASRELTIGIVGIGTVGGDVARRLLRAGKSVFIYDKDPLLRSSVKGAIWCKSLRALVKRCEAIVGCTGEDLFENARWLEDIEGPRLLASCSSEDIEFRSVLKLVHWDEDRKPLSPRTVQFRRGSLQILRGGFPANFTGTKNSGPVSLIQVTRALLLAGVIQAAVLRSSKVLPVPRRIMLDPWMQAKIARAFLTPGRQRLVDVARVDAINPEWLATRSTGTNLGPLVVSRQAQGPSTILG